MCSRVCLCIYSFELILFTNIQFLNNIPQGTAIKTDTKKHCWKPGCTSAHDVPAVCDQWGSLQRLPGQPLFILKCSPSL